MDEKVLTLTVDGVEVPPAELPLYALRMYGSADHTEYSLYRNGKRLTKPWTMVANISVSPFPDSAA